MIKIAIAEDNPRLRSTLVEALKSFEDVEFLFAAKNGKDLIHLCAKEKKLPDLVLMDIDMPVMHGIEATTRMKKQFPQTRIMMLTIFDQDDKIFDSIAAGADGYLLKGEQASRIQQAIRDCMEDRLPMSPYVARIALKLTHKPQKSAPGDFNLTAREIEVLKLLTEGKSYQEVASELFISEKTVRNHIHSIYKKIQVSSKAQAIHKAYSEHWFD